MAALNERETDQSQWVADDDVWITTTTTTTTIKYANYYALFCTLTKSFRERADIRVIVVSVERLPLGTHPWLLIPVWAEHSAACPRCWRCALNTNTGASNPTQLSVKLDTADHTNY